MAQRNEFSYLIWISHFIFAKSFQWLVSVTAEVLKCHSAFLVWRILRKIVYNTLPTVIFYENRQSQGDKHTHNTQIDNYTHTSLHLI